MEGQREKVIQEGNGVPSAKGGFQHERVSEETSWRSGQYTRNWRKSGGTKWYQTTGKMGTQ
eukprot:14474211-Heterocapsa_arctica.AAC.1